MEQEDINKFIGGCRLAFRKVYDFFWKKVLAVARREFKNPQEAEDFVQDLFVHIWERREMFRGVKNFDKYLFRITWNLIYTERDKRVNRKRLDDEHISDPVNITRNNVDDQSIENDYKEIVEFALAYTTPRRAEIYRLSREQGLSVEEIAIKLNLATQTVYNEITSALKTIRMFVNTHLASILMTACAAWFLS